MNTPVKVVGFVLALGAVFATAVAAGTIIGPATVSAESTSAAVPAGSMSNHSGSGTNPDGSAADGMAPEAPAGLASAQDGYRLQLTQRSLPAGAQTLSFQIDGPDGLPVTDYQQAHDKDLHLIVVRRDLTGFQHVHPVLGADGTWSVPLDIAAAGEYRVFADFVPTGHDRLTLGADLGVAGDYQPQPLPVPMVSAEVDGYTVTLDGHLTAGQESQLTLWVSKDGRPVTDLQPYLAAYGHLVALRDGDLGYLHVHPAGAPGDGVTAAGPAITFFATAPSAGDYRLFLDFQHDGVVRTAAFTARAEQPPASGAATADLTPATADATEPDGPWH